MPSLAAFNQLADAETGLLRCCGSRAWAGKVAQGRPYASLADLHAASERAWRSCTREDRLEAFSHHPRIGEKQLREKFAATAGWAEQEQKGASGASEATLAGLARGNDEYQRRFGYVFLVCATGKSADEMLALLRQRLPNDPVVEIDIAAGEQAKITRLRLEKWLNP